MPPKQMELIVKDEKNRIGAFPFVMLMLTDDASREIKLAAPDAAAQLWKEHPHLNPIRKGKFP